MPGRTTKSNEVLLNSIAHPITGGVRSMLASIYPPKQLTGDPRYDDQPRASVLVMNSWRDGIGLNKMRTPDQAGRSWWSTCNLSYHGHLVPLALATLTAASGVSGAFTVGAIGELANEIYAAFGTSVRKYNNTTDSWGSSLATLPAAATDAITFRMGGTVYLAFVTAGTAGGYTYTSDGSSFNDDTKDTQFLSYWDDRLWGIDFTGQIWFSTAIGVETNAGQLPLPNSSVTNLEVGRLADGDLALYAATTYGPYAYDVDNAVFHEVELAIPQHPDSGKGFARWRDALYYSVGNGIHRYGAGEGPGAAVSGMGPDRDDGLPSDKRGVIRQLLSTPNELVCIIDATVAPGSDAYDNFNAENAPNAADVISIDTGFSSILGWDTQGWQVRWLSDALTQAITYAYVSNAYSTYRLWWAHNARIYYMSIPRDIVNPNELATYPYAASAEHETAWFDAGQVEVTKTALELRVETAGCTSTETVTPSYGTNYSTSYTALTAITSNGVTSYLFPDSTTPTGTDFRAMRFKFALARGSTTTLKPDVISATLIYRKKLPAKYGHEFEIDFTVPVYAGRTAAERRAALITAMESTTLVEFTFRDDSGNDRNLYVDVVQATGIEATGRDERGKSTVTTVEA